MVDSPRVIAHLDMDAFYASVELLRYPELRGLPVVIGGGARHQPVWHTDPVTGARTRRYARLRGYTGRGVITTATYEARALGVNSAMGLMRAARRAPDAILLPVDFDEYRRYSRRFKASVAGIAPVIEDRGIDEIYIDLTDVVAARLGEPDAVVVDDPDAAGAATGDDDPPCAQAGGAPPDAVHSAAEAWWCAREVAHDIKQAVRTATGLTCSIGLAPNKLIAKIASELDKPDGLTVVTAQDIDPRIWPLPVRRPEGRRQAGAARHRDHRRTGGSAAGVAGAAVRRQLRRLAACRCARARRATGGHGQRAEVDQPRDDVRARPARGARPCAAVADLHRAVRTPQRAPGSTSPQTR